MKPYVIVLFAIGTVSHLLAQGTVNFLNGPSTMVFVQNLPAPAYLLPPLNTDQLGPYYFALLTAPAGTTSPVAFTFSGIYATNTTVAGRFDGGSGVTVPGWIPGGAMAFEIVGWSADGGPAWNENWLTNASPNIRLPSAFGLSGIGTGMAGGSVSTGTLAPLNLFGGATGIQGGFTLFTTFVGSVPEPSAASLICIGAAVLLLRRQRERNRAAVDEVGPSKN